MSVLNVQLDPFIVVYLKAGIEERQGLKVQYLVELQLARVVLLYLQVALVSLWLADRTVEQLDQHRQVVGKVRFEALHVLQLGEKHHVALVLVQEVVVILREQFNFYLFRLTVKALFTQTQRHS